MPWEDWLQFAQEHWLPIATYVLFFLATVIPSIRLLHRTGIHLWWAVFNLIPLRRDHSSALGDCIFGMAKAHSIAIVAVRLTGFYRTHLLALAISIIVSF